MNKTLTYAGFAAACLFVILLFVTAKSYTQLGLAIVIYPLVAYFALKIFPREQRVQTVPQVHHQTQNYSLPTTGIPWNS